MTIEAKLDRTNELLEALLGKFDHIGSAARLATPNPKETLEDVVKAPPKKTPPADKPETAAAKKKRLAAEKKAAAAAEKAAKEAAAKESDEVPDAADVAGNQKFKKTIVDIGRNSGDPKYAKRLRGVLAEEGYAHSEKVPADEYDDIIEKVAAEFADGESDDDI